MEILSVRSPRRSNEKDKRGQIMVECYISPSHMAFNARMMNLEFLK